MDEVKSAGVSFFFNFYLDVQQLMNQFAVYEGGMIVFENKYKDIYDKDFSGVDETDNDKIMQLSNNMRFYITRCILAYRTVKRDFKQEISPKEEEMIKAVKGVLIPKCSDVEKLIIELNTFVSKGALQDLFTKNEDLIQQLFKVDAQNDVKAQDKNDGDNKP